jgi:hypothetical protein
MVIVVVFVLFPQGDLDISEDDEVKELGGGERMVGLLLQS